MTQERLKELLEYNPDTGEFRWRVSTARRIKVGDIAGCYDDINGYIVIGIDGKIYKAHRLAWMYMFGQWPVDEIDHANRKRDDNHIDNLREADRSKQMANGSAHKDGSSGFKWVTWHKRTQKWMSSVMKDGKDYYLGLFDNPMEAHLVAYKKAIELHGEYVCV